MKQDSCDVVINLDPDSEKRDFYWADANKRREVRLSLDRRHEHWSGRISLSNIENHHMQVINNPYNFIFQYASIYKGLTQNYP